MRFVLRAVLALVVLIVAAGGVAYLVLRRGDIPYATLEETYANAQSRYVTLPSGVRMHCRDQGNPAGPALVMVHGFAASLYTWEGVLPHLGDTYRIVTLDLPGHGLTQAPDGYDATIDAYVSEVEAFANALNLERFAIAGSSMGGNVAWEYALAHPQRTQGLILIGASGWPEDSTGETPLVFRLLESPVARTVLRDLDSTMLIRDGLKRSFADPSIVDDAMVTRYASFARAPGHRDILMNMRGARRPASNDVLAALTVPTLILWGEQDHLVDVSGARQFAAAIAGSELVIWPDDGHLPQEEHPERTAAAIADFLARVHAAAAPQEAVTHAP